MTIFSRLFSIMRRGLATYRAIFLLPFQRTAYKQYLEEEELFMLMCFSEVMGFPFPISYYTLELYPYFSPRFHQWHRRMGMEHSPLDEIKCC